MSHNIVIDVFKFKMTILYRFLTFGFDWLRIIPLTFVYWHAEQILTIAVLAIAVWQFIHVVMIGTVWVLTIWMMPWVMTVVRTR